MKNLTTILKMIREISRMPAGQQTLRTVVHLLWVLVVLTALPQLLAIILGLLHL